MNLKTTTCSLLIGSTILSGISTGAAAQQLPPTPTPTESVANGHFSKVVSYGSYSYEIQVTNSKSNEIKITPLNRLSSDYLTKESHQYQSTKQTVTNLKTWSFNGAKNMRKLKPGRIETVIKDLALVYVGSKFPKPLQAVIVGAIVTGVITVLDLRADYIEQVIADKTNKGIDIHLRTITYHPKVMPSISLSFSITKCPIIIKPFTRSKCQKP